MTNLWSVIIFPFGASVPVIWTPPEINPPVLSYLSSSAVCNPSVNAIVKSPSSIVSCFVPISVIIFVVPTTKSPAISTLPVVLIVSQLTLPSLMLVMDCSSTKPLV